MSPLPSCSTVFFFFRQKPFFLLHWREDSRILFFFFSFLPQDSRLVPQDASRLEGIIPFVFSAFWFAPSRIDVYSPFGSDFVGQGHATAKALCLLYEVLSTTYITFFLWDGLQRINPFTFYPFAVGFLPLIDSPTVFSLPLSPPPSHLFELDFRHPPLRILTQGERPLRDQAQVFPSPI